MNSHCAYPKYNNYDIVVIGAGVAGCCVARELARYSARILVVEAGLDIAELTTRANSGIVHAGYDPVPGTLKAKYNVWGARIYSQWADELEFLYTQNGAMVVGFDESDVSTIHKLFERGLTNGLQDGKDLQILDGEEARAIEPNLSDEIVCALHVKNSGICDPYQVAFRSAENAANNGVEFLLDTKVVGVDKTERDGKVVYNIDLGEKDTITARAVVNAAGLQSDTINNMVSNHKLNITPKRGEYCLFDTQFGTTFTNTIFQCPTDNGKGVLVSPTVHGNLFIGPTSEKIGSKKDYSTSKDGLEFIQYQAKKSWPGLDMRGLITNFSGVRACGDTHDFIVGEQKDASNFFNIAGLESPGLSSAPAIAIDIANKCSKNLELSLNNKFNPRNTVKKRYFEMSEDERIQAVAKNKDFGHVICRCRQVTEGEIVDALCSPIPVLSMDALKWRTGATMGRCHGGFCTPELVKYLCDKYDIEPSCINKRNSESWMFSKNRPDYLDRLRDEDGFGKFGADGFGKFGADGSVKFGADGFGKFEADGSVKFGADGFGKYADTNKDTTLQHFDVLVVGGGAAGIAAAHSARKNGAGSVCIVDREARLGGILKQCIHSGFGLEHFNEELTGPEYAQREIDAVNDDGNIKILTKTMVTKIKKCQSGFCVNVSNKSGYKTLKATSVVMASGSRERGFGSLNIFGTRPSGIYTAGSAQNLINLQGVLPGREAVVLGSGDIGLIMARRMVLSGMRVKAVYEIMPNPSGLRRNISQCLDDFNIPLYLSKTVVATNGQSRLTSVVVADVDENLRPIKGSEQTVECDTLVLSVGLIPEAELAVEAGATPNETTKSVKVDDTFQTEVPGLFACGNALHIHDLVDYATAEGQGAGLNAAKFALANKENTCSKTEFKHYAINNNHKDELEAKHSKAEGKHRQITCTRCPNGCSLIVELNDAGCVVSVNGNKCERGVDYAVTEIKNPSRNFSAIVMSNDCLEPISVKTSAPISKKKLLLAAAKLRTMQVDGPINCGDKLVDNIVDSGVNIVATKSSNDSLRHN